MRHWREEAAAAAADGKYDTVVEIITAHDQLCSADLLLKGRCIQLSSGGKGCEPDDAAEAFQKAFALDPDYVPAMIELGWIYLSVFDEPERGKEYFERAIEVTRRNAIEAFRGALLCAEEISGAKGRAEVLRRASTVVSEQDLEEPAETAPE